MPGLLIVVAVLVTNCKSATVTGEYLGCAYTPKQTPANPYPEMQPFDHCALRVGADIQLEPKHLEALDFGEEGLATIYIGEQFYYVKPDGAKAQVLAWEEFSEGLARTVIDRKIAYIDKRFDIRLAPQYDYAWPFEDGVALVCMGCRAEQTADGEHTARVGGVWGFIDKTGNEVVPVRYPGHREAYDALERAKADRSP